MVVGVGVFLVVVVEQERAFFVRQHGGGEQVAALGEGFGVLEALGHVGPDQGLPFGNLHDPQQLAAGGGFECENVFIIIALGLLGGIGLLFQEYEHGVVAQVLHIQYVRLLEVGVIVVHVGVLEGQLGCRKVDRQIGKQSTAHFMVAVSVEEHLLAHRIQALVLKLPFLAHKMEL